MVTLNLLNLFLHINIFKNKTIFLLIFSVKLGALRSLQASMEFHGISAFCKTILQ